ncbi:MAG: ester cyclase [Thermoplasmata archaeon]|jgi:predicted ester cyclase
MMKATTSPMVAGQVTDLRNHESGIQGEIKDHVTVVRRLIEEGFNRGDLTVLDQILDPEYLEHQSLAPGVPPTREAVPAMIRALRAGFPDLHLSIEAVDTAEDRVWLRLHATGTHKGPFMGNPPTGRKMSIDVLDVCRIRRGRIVEHWGVPDHLTLFEQLGL